MPADLRQWLPINKKEMELHGWDEVDVVLISGDAYVDHPSFGAAVIGRVTADRPGWVVLNTEVGTQTLLPQPTGELLPRIC